MINDFDEYFLYAVDSVINSVDFFVFAVNDTSNNNKNEKTSQEFYDYIENFVKSNVKFKLLKGHWETEPEQRNAAAAYGKELGCSIALIHDSDEVYENGSVEKIFKVLEETDYVCVRGNWLTFWKKSPLCFINPPEGYCPVLAYNIHKYTNTELREGMGLSENGEIIIPKTFKLGFEQIRLYHFSYARSDEFIKKKIDRSYHNHQMIPGWYENTWLKWKIGDENLHNCNPSQYKTAVPFPLEQLPPRIRGFFKMLQEKQRWKNIKY